MSLTVIYCRYHCVSFFPLRWSKYSDSLESKTTGVTFTWGKLWWRTRTGRINKQRPLLILFWLTTTRMRIPWALLDFLHSHQYNLRQMLTCMYYNLLNECWYNFCRPTGLNTCTRALWISSFDWTPSTTCSLRLSGQLTNWFVVL